MSIRNIHGWIGKRLQIQLKVFPLFQACKANPCGDFDQTSPIQPTTHSYIQNNKAIHAKIQWEWIQNTRRKKKPIKFVLFHLFRNPLVWKVASCKNIEKQKKKNKTKGRERIKKKSIREMEKIANWNIKSF